MKNRIWIILPAIMLILLVTLVSMTDIQKGNKMPEDIAKILSHSCYNCHTTGAKAEDAVKTLDFEIWDEYKATKKVGLLNEIKEVVEEGNMPPEKFLTKYPDKAPSEEDRNKIVEWTKEETAKLMK